ncbi:MAG TPA: flagellar protein FliS [Candidatus Krumholzibacteria bacterium]|nr:flagellar protein FliS [Candidatus Krumholzibacteria bacterium]HPD71650.1 flagellar protein FliS [Candidatus Krumholzibacteria bacterium]HRY41417.1 flagellar protein FliS [Candidatus Krumholzibacteria bacterium]
MHYRRGVQTYRETDLQTMGKEKLIVLLYQKMLEHFAAAADAAGGDRPEMSRRLGLAQRIVTELRGALDHAVGGQIAENLAALYNFAFHEILQMQVDQDPVHAVNCQRVLEPLLEAWRAIPPGAGDRELNLRRQAGTESAPVEPSAPGPERPVGDRLISLSA